MTEGSFWSPDKSESDWEDEMWETEGSYYEDDHVSNYNQSAPNKTFNETEWNKWFEVDIVHENGNSIDYNFMDWSVGGEDMVWFEPEPVGTFFSALIFVKLKPLFSGGRLEPLFG